MMKKVFVIALAVTSVAAMAQDAPKLDVEFKTTLSSKYVWRGINLVNNWVLQPEISVGKNGFKAGLWGNLELTDHNRPTYAGRNPAGKFTEWDLWLEYTHSFEGFDGTVGYIDYQFPNTGFARYSEWYLGVAAKHEWNPELTVYVGRQKAMGLYANLGVSKSFAPMSMGSKSYPLNFAAWVGFGDKKGNNFFYGNNKAGFADFGASLGTSMSFGEWSFAPTLYYSNLFDRNSLAGAARRQNAWVSASLSRKF